MSTQRVAQVFGIVFVLVGLLGFALCGFGMEECLLLGLFPVNVLHNLAHLVLGIWGIMAAKTLAGAVSYCRIAGVIYLVLTLLGFVAPDTFGLIPNGGYDRWLHLVLGVILAYFGFRKEVKVPAVM
jgi:hypothetical protein